MPQNSPPPLHGSSRRPVLLVGIDGVRWPLAAREGVAPTLAGVADRAWHRLDVVPQDLAGPVWTSVLTGVTSDAHGVRENFFVDHRLADHPDLLAQAAQAEPDARTFAAAGWRALADPQGAGPVIATRPSDIAAGRHRIAYPDGDDMGLVKADRQVRNATVAALRADRAPDVAFAYFCGPDEAAYDFGVEDPRYAASLSIVDQHLADLLSVLTSRAGDRSGIGTHSGRSHRVDRTPAAGAASQPASREDWLVVIVTDHGLRDGGGRGDAPAKERVGAVLLWAADGRLPDWPSRIAPEELAGLILAAGRD